MHIVIFMQKARYFG